MSSKKIFFIAKTEEIWSNVEAPAPAVTEIPDWYKKSLRFKDSRIPQLPIDASISVNGTIKGCIPVLDSLSMGYIQKSWCDLYVQVYNDEPTIKHSGGIPIVGSKESWSKGSLPAPKNYYDILFNFKRPWTPQTPSGYSVLYTHPPYRTDLPFLILPGVVDSDVFQGAGEGSPPFFLQKGFEGLIPKGTPLYQIIPFKRDNWESENIFSEKTKKQLLNLQIRNKSRFWDRYKKEFWQKKKYL